MINELFGRGRGVNINNMNVNFNMKNQQGLRQFDGVPGIMNNNNTPLLGNPVVNNMRQIEYEEVDDCKFDFGGVYVDDDYKIVIKNYYNDRPDPSYASRVKVINFKNKPSVLIILDNDEGDKGLNLFISDILITLNSDGYEYDHIYMILEESGDGDFNEEPLKSSFDNTIVLFRKTCYKLTI